MAETQSLHRWYEWGGQGPMAFLLHWPPPWHQWQSCRRIARYNATHASTVHIHVHVPMYNMYCSVYLYTVVVLLCVTTNAFVNREGERELGGWNDNWIQHHALQITTQHYWKVIGLEQVHVYARVHTHTHTNTHTHTHAHSLSHSHSHTFPLSYRLVYRWFLFIYQATYVMGIVGYIILLLIFTGIGLLLPIHPDTIMEFGVTLIFYGVYYGVMGRDCAELCVDYMAAGMTVSGAT